MLLIIIFSLSLTAAIAADETVSRSIVVQSTQGSDIVLTKGTDKKFTAKAGTRLASGYTLATGKDSYVWLKLDDDSTVKMNASTKLDISRASGKELKLTVINGSISFNAGEQTEGNKTSVKAGNSTMGLRGTLFTVTYIDGVMYVTLLDGMLEGSTPDGSYILEAGNGLVVSDGADDINKFAEIYPLDIEKLDLFTLETITENTQTLLESGIITEGEIERINEIKERVREEQERREEQSQEQSQTGTEAPQDEKEKIYLPETGNQNGGNQDGGNQGQYYGPTTYTVVFKDYDGTVLKTETVARETAATPPEVPVREGYIFTGWDVGFGSVTGDLVVTALYSAVSSESYTVVFKDYDGSVLKTETVARETAATPPEVPVREGYVFTGWDVGFGSVTGDLVVTALYSEAPSESYIVVFKDYDGSVLKTETVARETAATPPEVPVREGYVFTGWDVGFGSVTGDLVVTALYEEVKAEVFEVVFRDYDGTVIGSEQVQGTEDLPYPPNPSREGYTFSGWSGIVLESGVCYVTAQYTVKTYTVVFKDYDGTVLKSETVEHGMAAVPPASPVRAGYIFTGWDVGFGSVTGDLTVTAVYKLDDPVITASFTDANFLAEIRTIAENRPATY